MQPWLEVNLVNLTKLHLLMGGQSLGSIANETKHLG
jgi:hypothetical protein